jgi:hypothetical protein
VLAWLLMYEPIIQEVLHDIRGEWDGGTVALLHHESAEAAMSYVDIHVAVGRFIQYIVRSSSWFPVTGKTCGGMSLRVKQRKRLETDVGRQTSAQG